MGKGWGVWGVDKDVDKLRVGKVRGFSFGFEVSV